jgi:hypothetical protein
MFGDPIDDANASFGRIICPECKTVDYGLAFPRRGLALDESFGPGDWATCTASNGGGMSIGEKL